ncbi:AI-2E family transporter [Alkalimonas collagenimarina]|uniref:AI-2E family transporter n=1 Tax=Alkalimonas collagenimarina TaxID=400390 RepID=A0ABT9H0D8_9GAMM|nr:AI-2E family transporter [Alkalimonas collagenimarina]MDP4536395.1 AI-2E family transporter [Alkalimonas collagenimarina]
MTTAIQHSATRILVACAALVITLAGIKAAAAIVVPFLLAIFIAIICSPLIQLLHRWHVPKLVSILLVIALIVLFGTALTGIVVQSLIELSRSLPEYQAQLNNALLLILNRLADYHLVIEPRQLLSYINPGSAITLATNTLAGLGTMLTNTLLIVLIVVFMLLEAHSIPAKVQLAMKNPTERLQQMSHFLHSVNRYIAIKTMMSLLTGIVVGFLLWMLGVSYALLWGIFAFLLNYIPNIGSIIAAVPAVLMAFVDGGLSLALGTSVVFIAVNLLVGNMLEPRYMGRGLGLSTLVVFLSLIFWGWMLGAVGMLLSIPLTMIVKIGLESSESGRWIAILLDSEEQTQARKAALAESNDADMN